MNYLRRLDLSIGLSIEIKMFGKVIVQNFLGSKTGNWTRSGDTITITFLQQTDSVNFDTITHYYLLTRSTYPQEGSKISLHPLDSLDWNRSYYKMKWWRTKEWWRKRH